MNQAINISLLILSLTGSIWLGLKLLEIYQKYKADKYQTNQHHFIADLYKLQIKWAERGEIGFSESLTNLIKFQNTPEKPNQPLTNDALSTELMLKRNRLQEMKAALEEVQSEFIG